MHTRCVLLSYVAMLGFFGCRTSVSPSSSAKSDMETSSPNYMDDGFTIKIERESRPDKRVESPEAVLVLEDGFGRELSRAPYSVQQFALDRKTLEDGTVIYSWPKSKEVIKRDFKRLGELMTEYSETVGTLLHQEPTGPGEEAWVSWIRTEQHSEIESARLKAIEKERSRSGETGQLKLRNVTKAWCNANVSQLVDRLVPEGSRFRQYGNCGEGGNIGACLASRSGFKESEIRLCLSANDHFFAMVYRGVENGTDHKWCILDRWPLIKNFSCGVDLDEDRRQVSQNGRLVNQKWFKRAGCTTLDKYLVDPHASLYGPVARY